ncbi:hypothetical protein HD554DRAFT_451226 [Boletus coccyginus]|nr:hypothetical protein HD554DRAFT_451226 [Boletus coccyginus]
MIQQWGDLLLALPLTACSARLGFDTPTKLMKTSQRDVDLHPILVCTLFISRHTFFLKLPWANVASNPDRLRVSLAPRDRRADKLKRSDRKQQPLYLGYRNAPTAGC